MTKHATYGPQGSTRSTVAIIPARGGSKGIPGKNLMEVGGIPLVVRAIAAAQAAVHVDLVVVTTDDADIANVAERSGATVVLRPHELATDTASSEGALLHALSEIAESGFHPEVTVFLQCTSPLTQACDIDGALGVLYESGADCVFSATPFSHFLWERDGHGEWVGINHDSKERQMRQARPEQLLETGAIYVMRTAGFVETKHRFFGRIATYEVPHSRSIEVDEDSDLVIARCLEGTASNAMLRDALSTGLDAIAFDFDGVFTDNRVLVFEDGSEAVRCDRGDGLGLAELRALEIPMIVISKERNPVAKARCEKLGLPLLLGVDEKLTKLREWIEEMKFDPARVVYVGNDTNDVDCLRFVGCGIAVADAHESARSSADYVLTKSGGCGALRELADTIVDLQGV